MRFIDVDANDLVGKKINRFTVLSYYGRAGKNKYHHYNCRCDCGELRVIVRSALLRAQTMSCGCYHKEQLKLRGKK